jgi:hypothetical protein
MKAATAPGGRALVALLLFVLAFAIRAVNLDTAFVNGDPQFPPLDDLYHLKRILYSFQHFPSYLEFDPDRGTRGEFCHWPPLYDVGAAAAARVTGARTPMEVMRRVTWLPPLVGAAFVAGVFLSLARRRPFAAVCAAMALAFSPPFLEVSRLASIDHHFLEPPLLLLIAWTTVRLRAPAASDTLARGAQFGLALTAGLFVQTTLLFAAGIALVAILLVHGRETQALRAAAIGFGVALAAVTLFRVTRPPGYPDFEWFLGSSQIAALLAACVASSVASLPRLQAASPVVRLASSVAAGMLAAVLVPGAAIGLSDGAALFGDPWIKTMVECRPLLDPDFDRLGSFSFLVGGAGLLLVPFLWTSVVRGERSRIVLGIFAAAYLVATFSSRRFAISLAPLLAVSSGLLADDCWKRRRYVAATLAAGALLVPFFVGSLPGISNPEPVTPQLAAPMIRAAQWLRAHQDGGRVLGPLSWGHLFDVVGRHPVVLDNFGSMVGRDSFRDNLRIFLSVDEDRVARYCRENGVRWIVLENPLRTLPVAVMSLDEPMEAFWRAGAGPRDPYVITRLAQSSFWWRAYFDGGREAPERGRWGRRFRSFALVYRDPAPSGEAAPYEGPASEIWEFTGAAPRPS